MHEEAEGKRDVQDMYPVTAHARTQLEARWPHTVLPFNRFDEVNVPTNAALVGYDGALGTSFVEVPGTPMVAVVRGGVVVTFLSADSVRAKLALRGYGPADLAREKLT